MDELNGSIIFIFNESTQTIQLYTHNKDWRLWWGLLVINAIISMVKLSSLTVLSLLSHITLGVGGLVILAIIIDATAQLLEKYYTVTIGVILVRVL